MAESKVPTLDAGGKVFDKHLPARLGESELSTTFVPMAGTVSPTVMKDSTDTRPGVFEWINDAPNGTLFHMLIGANATKTSTWIMTIGGDNPGNGFLWNAKTQGVGVKIDQNATVTGSDSYGLQVTQMNANSPAAFFATNVDGAADTMRLFATDNVVSPTQNLLHVMVDSSVTAGRIRAADGVIDWKRDIQTFGSSFRSRPDSLDADASTHHLFMDSNGWEVDSASGSAGQWWVGKIARDGWNMKFQGSQGFGGRGGTGTVLSTLITIGYGGKLSFFDAAPVSKPTAVPVTAAGVHAALVTLGLIAS
jgi:hypothetical protein